MGAGGGDMAAVRAELLRPGLRAGGGVIMVFGTGGAAGWAACAGLVGRDAVLVALSGATLAEEDDGDFGAGLATGLTTGFITDLATEILLMTSLVVDFFAGGTFLRVTGLALGCATLTGVGDTGFTIFLAVVLLATLATGLVAFLIGLLTTVFKTVLTATFTGVLLFLAMVFTSCLLWAVAYG